MFCNILFNYSIICYEVVFKGEVSNLLKDRLISLALFIKLQMGQIKTSVSSVGFYEKHWILLLIKQK